MKKDNLIVIICLCGVALFAILGTTGFFDTEETPQVQPQETIDEQIAIQEQKPELTEEEKEQSYKYQIETIYKGLTDPYLKLSKLFNKPTIATTIDKNSQEHQDAITQIQIIKDSLQKLNQIEPPQKYAELHQEFLATQSNYLQGCEILETSMKNKDTNADNAFPAIVLFKEAYEVWFNGLLSFSEN